MPAFHYKDEDCYDPDHAPNPKEWLALDEQERVILAEDYHRAKRIKLPSLKAHALFHVIVENQIAQNHGPVVRAMSRLAGEGLSRHESIHAIAWVLAEHIYDILKSASDEQPSNANYDAAVERLSAKDWLGG